MNPESIAELVIIEAPGKRRAVQAALSALGRPATVLATGGHFWAHPAGLRPLGVTRDFAEPGRLPDPAMAAQLQQVSAGRTVILAMDDDDEGEAIALDVARVVAGVARTLRRARLRDLSLDGLTRALRDPLPFVPAHAAPAVARRILDRLIGAACSGHGVGAGRVSVGLLAALAADPEPIIGEIDLVLPASDGGAPFRARVPVTAATLELWEERARSLESLHAAPSGRTSIAARPWNYGDTLIGVERVAP